MSHAKDMVFLLVVSIFFLAPLGHPRFFWSHDEAQLLWRITELHANTVAGQPLCRWFPDFARGFGLPFLEFFPVLFLYYAELFKILGFSTIGAAKIGITTSYLAGTYFTYRFSRDVWNRWGGLVSGTLFAYTPYRIFNIYVRGDVNEFTAMSLLPLNLWLIYRIYWKSGNRWLSLPLLCGTALLCLAHYPSCVIQLPIYAFWVICLTVITQNRRRFVVQASLSMAMGLIVTSTYWFSAFIQRHLVQMEGMTRGFADYRDQFIHPAQWISSYWNYGASVKGTGDTVSFQIGNLALCIALIGVAAVFRRNIRNSPVRMCLLTASVGLILLTLFLMTSASRIIWDAIPLLPMLQFPYRLIQIPAFLLVILAGSLGVYIENNYETSARSLVTLIAAVTVLVSVDMCNAVVYLNLREPDLIPSTVARVSHTHCTNEFTPRAVGKRFPPANHRVFTLEKIPEEGYSRHAMEQKLAAWLLKAPEPEYWDGSPMQIGERNVLPGQVIVTRGRADVTRSNLSTRCQPVFDIVSHGKSQLIWAHFYFEGWSALLDNTPIHLEPDPETGFILIQLPSGKHQLKLGYRNLPLARHLWLLCILTLMVVLLVELYLWRKKVVHD